MKMRSWRAESDDVDTVMIKGEVLMKSRKLTQIDKGVQGVGYKHILTKIPSAATISQQVAGIKGFAEKAWDDLNRASDYPVRLITARSNVSILRN